MNDLEIKLEKLKKEKHLTIKKIEDNQKVINQKTSHNIRMELSVVSVEEKIAQIERKMKVRKQLSIYKTPHTIRDIMRDGADCFLIIQEQDSSYTRDMLCFDGDSVINKDKMVFRSIELADTIYTKGSAHIWAFDNESDRDECLTAIAGQSIIE